MTDDIKRNKLRDLAAIASLLGGVGTCLYFGTLHRSPTVRISSGKFNSSLYQLELEHLLGGENDVRPTDLHDADEVETDASHDMLRPAQHERFRKGQPAELYGPLAPSAVPVVVDSVDCHDGDRLTVVDDGQSCDEGNRLTYSVTDLKSGKKSYGVDPMWVHRYERYQDGTKALCLEQVKVRGTEPSIVPCLVKSSHVEKSNGGVDYPVYYVARIDDDTSELVLDYLPFQNVQRLIDEHALDGSHVLELLEDDMTLNLAKCA